MHFGNHSGTVRDLGRGGGKQWRFKFDNGFGASVINDGYGRESGLYELAVLDANENITYDTPITNDVLGYLSGSEVAETLDRVAALSAAEVEAEGARRSKEERDGRIAALRAELAALEDEAVSR